MTDLITRLRALDEKMTPEPWVVAMNGPSAEMDSISRPNAIHILEDPPFELLEAIATLRNFWPLVVDALEAGEDMRTYRDVEMREDFDTALAALQEALDADDWGWLS